MVAIRVPDDHVGNGGLCEADLQSRDKGSPFPRVLWQPVDFGPAFGKRIGYLLSDPPHALLTIGDEDYVVRLRPHLRVGQGDGQKPRDLVVGQILAEPRRDDLG